MAADRSRGADATPGCDQLAGRVDGLDVPELRARLAPRPPTAAHSWTPSGACSAVRTARSDGDGCGRPPVQRPPVRRPLARRRRVRRPPALARAASRRGLTLAVCSAGAGLVISPAGWVSADCGTSQVCSAGYEAAGGTAADCLLALAAAAACDATCATAAGARRPSMSASSSAVMSAGATAATARFAGRPIRRWRGLACRLGVRRACLIRHQAWPGTLPDPALAASATPRRRGQSRPWPPTPSRLGRSDAIGGGPCTLGGATLGGGSGSAPGSASRRPRSRELARRRPPGSPPGPQRCGRRTAPTRTRPGGPAGAARTPAAPAAPRRSGQDCRAGTRCPPARCRPDTTDARQCLGPAPGRTAP